MVVCLTVRNPIPVGEEKKTHTNSLWSLSSAATEIRPLDAVILLADVLSGQSAAALAALEAGDVPLPLQSQQGLSLLDLLAAAGAVYDTTEEKESEE